MSNPATAWRAKSLMSGMFDAWRCVINMGRDGISTEGRWHAEGGNRLTKIKM